MTTETYLRLEKLCALINAKKVQLPRWLPEQRCIHYYFTRNPKEPVFKNCFVQVQCINSKGELYVESQYLDKILEYEKDVRVNYSKENLLSLIQYGSKLCSYIAPKDPVKARNVDITYQNFWDRVSMLDIDSYFTITFPTLEEGNTLLKVLTKVQLERELFYYS